MQDHIFDILGIGSREDSYTDLIAYAFRQSIEFRENLLALFGEQGHDDWQPLVRLPVSIISESGRRKDVPDLVFVNKSAHKVLLIENKVFSGEGWKQTERYASEEFKNSLGNYLNLTTPSFKFFFLTIDETAPYSQSFKPISYLDIANTIPEKLGNSALDLLLMEFRERVNEYYHWPLPQENDVVLEYFKRTSRLVNSYRTFRILTDHLLIGFDFIRAFGITANRGSGYIPLCFWYKTLWVSNEYPEERDGAKCFHIHFEFQWDTRPEWENLILYLHHHTNPYMTQAELRDVPKEFINGFENARKTFLKCIRDRNLTDWIIKSTPLGLAQYRFDKTIRYGELKSMMESLVSRMVTVVEKYLE